MQYKNMPHIDSRMKHTIYMDFRTADFHWEYGIIKYWYIFPLH